MKPITLQFVLGAGASSRLIAWWGQGYGGYSHVDAVLSDGMLLGARDDAVKLKDGRIIPPGVHCRPPDYESWKRVWRGSLEVPDALAEIWETALLSQRRKQYDEWNIIDFMLGREHKCDGAWICSALQLFALRTVDICHGELTPQQCPPNMLKAMFECCGGRRVGGTEDESERSDNAAGVYSRRSTDYRAFTVPAPNDPGAPTPAAEHHSHCGYDLVRAVDNHTRAGWSGRREVYL